MDNWYDWQTYVNNKIDEFQHYMEVRERDLEMANLRLQRLLDAALQRIGETESVLLPESESDTNGTGNDTDGPTASSSSVKTSG